MTHREYLMRLAFLDSQMDVPSRNDYYLMAIAAEVRRVLSKNPRRIKLLDFLLKFPKKNQPTLTQEQVAKTSKNRWLGIIGKSIKNVVVMTREPED